MHLDFLSFVLGALAVLIAVALWCWVRRPPKWECDVATLARRAIAEFNLMPPDDPSDGAAIRRTLAVLEDALEDHTVLEVDHPEATDPFRDLSWNIWRRGFQPETQSANPRLPDGSVPVSGVQERCRLCEGTGFFKGDREFACCCILGHSRLNQAKPILATRILRGYQPQSERCGREDVHSHRIEGGERVHVLASRGAPCLAWPREPEQPPPSGASLIDMEDDIVAHDEPLQTRLIKRKEPPAQDPPSGASARSGVTRPEDPS